ncbi:IclR family transcriptional regulator [Salinigranum marinum]|uniref:IclR family transcriptional regulator n=1 Tax=Salinigranum marinum TaxID=1515595 RepID=UPI002989BCC2|nr:IclR family transcriptional regulator [Salinigranum marinum]
MGTSRVLSTTNNSLEVIETIIKLDGASLSEISDELEMARSAVHTHLNTLLKHGYVVREGNVYRIGLKLVHLGEYAKNQHEVHSMAEKWVSRLAERTELETDFTVEENGRIISLYDSTKYSTDGVTFLDNGRYYYCHNTAAGKAILSHYSEEKVGEILDQWGMPSDTSRSITTRGEFFDELQRVRERGYATSLEECIESLNAAARAVQNPRGQICGAFVVTGPSYVLDETRIKEVSNQLVETAQEYERNLERYYEVSE